MEKKNIYDLVTIFNNCRSFNEPVDKISNEIATTLILEYKENIWKNWALNEQLLLEIHDGIMCLLSKTESLKIIGNFHKKREYGNAGLANENGEIIFASGEIGRALGKNINEFLSPDIVDFNAAMRPLEVMGIMTKNVICIKDKMYYSSKIQNFSEPLVAMNDLRNQEDYVCKKYNDNGLLSINYIYPTHPLKNNEIAVANMISFYDSHKENVVSNSTLKNERHLLKKFDYFVTSEEPISKEEWTKLVELNKLANLIKTSKINKVR